MNESIIRLDDMRLAAALAGASSFTAVGKLLSMPKQTVARRVGLLEEALKVRLVERSTRTFRLTAIGQSYAERCAELVRLAEATNQEVRGETTEVAGTLRVTADPLLGELFLPALLSEFAMAKQRFTMPGPGVLQKLDKIGVVRRRPSLPHQPVK